MDEKEMKLIDIIWIGTDRYMLYDDQGISKAIVNLEVR